MAYVAVDDKTDDIYISVEELQRRVHVEINEGFSDKHINIYLTPTQAFYFASAMQDYAFELLKEQVKKDEKQV